MDKLTEVLQELTNRLGVTVDKIYNAFLVKVSVEAKFYLGLSVISFIFMIIGLFSTYKNYKKKDEELSLASLFVSVLSFIFFVLFIGFFLIYQFSPEAVAIEQILEYIK